MNSLKNNGGKRIGAGRKRLLPLPNSINYKETWNTIDTMLMKGVSGISVASRLGVSDKTFYRYGEQCGKWGKNSDLVDFGAYKLLKRQIGNDYLLERQFDLAMGIYDAENKRFIIPPNVPMLIWLGKNRLGQSNSLLYNSGKGTLQNSSPNVIIQLVSDKILATH
jgi:hypothetical protein